MADPKILEQFQRRLRYKSARPWQKPWICPGRFLQNQFRKFTQSDSHLGVLRTVPTFHCPEFTVVTGEKVSDGIASYGIYEEALTEAFLYLVEPGQVVVDIGMHIGYYTTLFATLVGPKGEVHAFEPTPSTREIARHNVQRFRQVHVHPYAVWSQAQELPFRDFGTRCMGFNSCSDSWVDQREFPEPKLLTVQTITLDQFRRELNKPISLAKVDAESAELEILRGAKEVLGRDRPIISLEFADPEGQPPLSRPLFEFLKTWEYQPWEFTGRKFIRHQPRPTYTYDNLILAPAARDLSRNA